MRIFLNKSFAKFASRQKIDDQQIVKAIQDAERGLIEADLGIGLIKQRISRPNEGKSGGYRSIIVYRHGDLSIFIYGFAKNEKDNISEPELHLLRDAAKVILEMDQTKLVEFLSDGRMREVEYHGKSL